MFSLVLEVDGACVGEVDSVAETIDVAVGTPNGLERITVTVVQKLVAVVFGGGRAVRGFLVGNGTMIVVEVLEPGTTIGILVVDNSTPGLAVEKYSLRLESIDEMTDSALERALHASCGGSSTSGLDRRVSWAQYGKVIEVSSSLDPSILF